MISKITNKILGINILKEKINQLEKILYEVSCDNDEKKFILGKLAANSLPNSYKSLEELEFKVYSQWGDDGIIQYLIKNIDITSKTFIEFGVENYSESNTRFLLQNNNWSGLIIDGSKSNINYVKSQNYYWRYNLIAKSAFITTENIEDLLQNVFEEREIGLLSIDIDGNDYWIWERINFIQPIIIIVEYNSLFGITRPITVPYDPNFVRTNYHYSNLFYGSSLLSLCDLAKEKGYTFIGSNNAGNNAYFIRNDKMNNHIKELSPSDGYITSRFRESRNENGELTFLSKKEQINIIKGLKVFNTRTKELETL